MSTDQHPSTESEQEDDGEPGHPDERPDEAHSQMSLLGLAFLGARTLARRSREAVTELAVTSAQRVEANALTTLKRKLEKLPDPDTGDVPAGTVASNKPGGGGASTGTRARLGDPAVLLGQLLEVSMEQSEEDARRTLYLAVLRQLLPDEARMLSALATVDGGAPQAMIHVGAATLIGTNSQRVLENFSNLARTAALRCPEAAPHYLKHLRELGLVDSGPEDSALLTRYQLLESDAELRQAIDHIEKVMKLKPRIHRHSIRLSAFGRQLWAACRPPAAGGTTA